MSSLGICLCFCFIAIVFGYDIGVTHNYKYETTVVINEECGEVPGEEPFGHKLKADVHLTTVWEDSSQKLIKLNVPEIKVFISKKSSFEERETGQEKNLVSESYFLLKNGNVEKFWDDPTEPLASRNLKRSVASLLQLKRKDVKVKELDVSGTCDVLYKVEGNIIRRSKWDCHHPLQDSILSQPFGVRSLSHQRSSGIDCELKDGNSKVLWRCMASEQVKSFSNLWKRSSICVQSTTQFRLENTAESKDAYKNLDYSNVIDAIKKKSGKLTEGDLLAVSKTESQPLPANVVDITKGFKESIKTENLAKLKSVSAFFKLLPTYRSASKEDILKVLKTKKLDSILLQVMDLLAASSTQDSIAAALDYFADEKEYNQVLERFLISLSVTPKPNAFVIKEIKTFLGRGDHHEKIEDTLVTTLGALLRTYGQNEKVDPKIIEEVLDYLESSLKKCDNDACSLRYLRGLRNAAHPRTVPLLLQYALKGGKPALEATLALRNVPSSQLSQENQNSLLKVFHQVGSKQDRSTRAVAAGILLQRNPCEKVLKSVLGSLSDQSDAEFSTFVTSKVLHLLDENKEFRSRISRILPEKDIAHYYALSQKGMSSLFKRQLLDTNDLNVTYGIEMELLEGGLLKRSTFDVQFESDSEVSNLLSVGMFAEGIASFAGGETSDEDASPTAGMELTLLGTSLRPYVFFSSTSELMGHAWSGTASEPTPALQGIFSLSDDAHLLVLHNGMVVRLDLNGAMSADLSAAIQVSIWSRNSQSQVKNAAALLVRGSAVVDSDVVRSRGEFLFYAPSAIEFKTDLEFYEAPFKMCLEMENQGVLFRHDFQKSVEVPGTKYSVKKTKKRKRFIPSRSFALHQINNELCRIMKGEMQ